MSKSLGKWLILAPGLVAGCVSDAPTPDLGPCAVLPDTALYEYGQIGIGTCLASPSDLAIRPDPRDPDNHFVVVVNANASSNFSGSSLLSIDASSIDLTCSANGMHEVEAFPLGMQEFAGRLDVDDGRGLGLLSARVNGQFDGDLTDVVFTLDLSDPRAPRFHDAGPRRWGPYRYVQVAADPWSVRINPWDGRAYVLGLTNHTVAALDLVSDPIRFLDLRGELEVGAAEFFDVDGSGSAPDFTLRTVIPGRLRDETVTATFAEGTTRLFHAVDDGAGSTELVALNAGDGRSFVPLAGGALVEPGGDWAAGGVVDGAVGLLGDGLGALLTGRDAVGRRSIGRMAASANALDWTASATPAVTPSIDGAVWDTTGVFDPDWLQRGETIHAWFSGGPGWGTAIGHATGSTLGGLVRAGDAALPDGADGQVLVADTLGWDSAAVFAPAVRVDGVSGDLFLYYTGHDGVPVAGLPGRPGIGLASSPDGAEFMRSVEGLDGTSLVLDAGESGAWDDLAVGWPTVLFDNGRWQMWYRGTDGVTWQVGRATSIDGVHWTRDPSNPVVGVGLELPLDEEPLRIFAQKVSPVSGYQIRGEVSGDVASLAFEGALYENTVAPVGFLVVGGQALGRGPSGAYDRDGAGAPSRVEGSDFIVYEGWQGSRVRLSLAQDLGAGAQRLHALPGAGWSGALAGLNGDAPSLPVRSPDASPTADGIAVVFSTGAGIALGQLTETDAIPTALEPLQTGVVLAAGGEDAFDGGVIEAPSLLVEGHDGQVRIAYAGARSTLFAIGIATAPSLASDFTRPTAATFPRGPAGAWDDASVTSPSLLFDDATGLYSLYYLGSDGGVQRVGRATSSDGLTWTRHFDADGVATPVFDPTDLSFVDGEGLHSVRVRRRSDGRLELWFEGRLDGVPRAGRALSLDGVRWSVITNPTTAGDRFSIETKQGDDDASTAIALGEPARQGEEAAAITLVEGFRVHGAGATEMILSPDGGYAVVTNKRANFVLVLDLRDDSTDEFIDANVNAIEAVFRIPQRYGVVGTRDLAFSPDGERLHVLLSPLVVYDGSDPELRTGTEALISLDWAQVTAEDSADGRLLLDDVVLSYLPVARGIEEDVGYRSEVSVGPSALALSADGARAYVANYNDNSLWIVALDAGARGAVIARVEGLDEAPSEVVLSPDGRVAYVANYLGQSRNSVGHSTIAVIDVDEASPRFGEVLTTLSNITSRSDRGCP